MAQLVKTLAAKPEDPSWIPWSPYDHHMHLGTQAKKAQTMVNKTLHPQSQLNGLLLRVDGHRSQCCFWPCLCPFQSPRGLGVFESCLTHTIMEDHAVQESVEVQSLQVLLLPHKAFEWSGPAFTQNLYPLQIQLGNW